jgi:ATP/maltotriose-dependent transcriptional regulator MalT
MDLAALSLRAQPDTAAALSRFSGDDLAVADYLRDELAHADGAGIRPFVSRTSMREFTPLG